MFKTAVLQCINITCDGQMYAFNIGGYTRAHMFYYVESNTFAVHSFIQTGRDIKDF